MAAGSEPRVSALLLAAGESRRMGAANKLLLEVGGEPLVRRAARVLLASALEEIVVVLGHEQARVAAALEGLALSTVVNPDYAQGQMSSVHAGLSALGASADGVMICLADQPLITPADLEALIRAFAGRGAKSIVVPLFEGRRGNPIVLAHEHRAAILGAGRNLGCKHLVKRNPELVLSVEWANDHVVRDLDSEHDLRALEAEDLAALS
jgi:molybdenum cofactor cytidylyltransferase